MTKTKQLGLGGVLACVLAGLIGCEFSGSGDSDSWNSGFSWVNFSGVYRAPSGGVLVSSFTSTTASGGTPGSTNVIAASENIGQGNGFQTTFAGVLSNIPIQPSSVTVTAGGYSLTDNGSGVLGGANASGTVDYGNGAIAVDLTGAPLGNGVSVNVKYSYVVITGGSGGGGTGGNSGASGKAIVTFTVFQTGNKLEITDNNGAKYAGRFGGVSTTYGFDGSNPAILPSVGDTVIAEYTAEGSSAAGKKVMLAGTYQGTIARGSDDDASAFLTNRRMLGTWVESAGKTGDINGQASPIGVSATTTTTP